MASVKVLVQSFAGEDIVNQIINTANNNTPSGIIPSATVARDSNGKVVSVDVNLPNLDAPGLVIATAKINENKGVAIVSPFPQTFADTMETLPTAGTEVQSISNDTIQLMLTSIPTSPTIRASRWKSYTPAITGTKSLALDCVGTDEYLRPYVNAEFAVGNEGYTSMPIAQLNLVSIKAYEVSMKMKIVLPTLISAPTRIQNYGFIYPIQGKASVFGYNLMPGATTPNWYFAPSFMSPSTYLSMAATSVLDFKYVVNPYQTSLYVEGVLVNTSTYAPNLQPLTGTAGSFFSTFMSFLASAPIPLNTAAPSESGATIVVDDYSFVIIDGQI